MSKQYNALWVLIDRLEMELQDLSDSYDERDIAEMYEDLQNIKETVSVIDRILKEVSHNEG